VADDTCTAVEDFLAVRVKDDGQTREFDVTVAIAALQGDEAAVVALQAKAVEQPSPAESRVRHLSGDASPVQNTAALRSIRSLHSVAIRVPD